MITNYVYKTTQNDTGHYYIGVHKGLVDDDYFGSGKIITSIIKKYGKDRLTKEIIKTFDTYKEALLFEKEIVNTELLKDPLCVNLKVGGEGGSVIGIKRSEESKEKIRLSKLGKKNPMYGKSTSELQKNKLRDYNKNIRDYNVTDDTKLKMSISASKRKMLNEKIITCPHCEKSGVPRNMKRWHFDNCKHKK